MAPLTSKQRNKLPGGSFAGPDRSYPINDANHARNALSRVAQFGSPALQAQVRSKVASRFPGVGKAKKKGPHHQMISQFVKRNGGY